MFRPGLPEWTILLAGGSSEPSQGLGWPRITSRAVGQSQREKRPWKNKFFLGFWLVLRKFPKSLLYLSGTVPINYSNDLRDIKTTWKWLCFLSSLLSNLYEGKKDELFIQKKNVPSWQNFRIHENRFFPLQFVGHQR